MKIKAMMKMKYIESHVIDLTKDVGDENNVIVKEDGHKIHINSITLT